MEGICAQLTIKYKEQTINKKNLKRAIGLSSFQSMYSFQETGDTRHHDSEHIIEISTEITFVLQLVCSAKCNF